MEEENKEEPEEMETAEAGEDEVYSKEEEAQIKKRYDFLLDLMEDCIGED